MDKWGSVSPSAELIQASREQVLRLLIRWLFLFPFQRCEDIAVALAPWRSLPTLTRSLAILQTRGLIEWMRAGSTRGKRLYYLSPAGLRWYLAQHQEPPANAEVVIRDMRESMTRLCPRLPALLPVQDTVNGLVTGAAEALTSAGRRASLIRWDWQREYSQRFLYRERVCHMRLEGVCSLCLRYDPARMEHMEVWHSVFLLHTPVQDAYLMRLRMDRFLRWRESPERWPTYSQVPLLLLLARTARQAEWWHQACLRAAEVLQVDLPQGAVAILPEDAHMRALPWHLAWRALGTNRSCHLRELLLPLAHAAVPIRVNLSLQDTAETAEQGKGREKEKTSGGTRHQRRSNQAYRLAQRAQQQYAKASGHARDIRLASLILVPRHREIMEMLLLHPLLSRENLQAMLGLERTSLNKLLASLSRLGVIASELTAADERWRLTEEGLRLLAACMRCHVRHLAFFPEDASELRQRGVRGLRHQVMHTAGVYSFFAMLARIPDIQVQWWETGAGCERSYAFGGRRYRFRPDALAEVSRGNERLRFWLEWDRGTVTGPGLARKITTYIEYLLSREYAREHRLMPRLLYVASDIAHERKFVRVASAALPKTLKLACLTTTVSLLNRQGLDAPIWLPIQSTGRTMSPESRSPPPDVSRRTLFEEDPLST